MSSLRARDQYPENYFYHVLNLSKGASLSEVHERYRTLSLAFHPDKQQDPESKEIATQNFLRIQKAYEVLSDPFLREVYDQLGYHGLTLDWPQEIRSSSLDDIREKLADVKSELRQARQKKVLSPQGTLQCSVYAVPLFGPTQATILDRISGVGLIDYTLRHKIQSKINDRTSFGLGAQMRSDIRRLDVIGTVQHQFSPRLSSSALIYLSFPFRTRLESSYQDGLNAFTIRAVGSLGAPLFLRPTLSASLTRKLFRTRNEQATIDVRVGRRPHVKLRLTSPKPFGIQPTADRHDSCGENSSLSGLETGIIFMSHGLDLEEEDIKLVGEVGVNLLELGTTFKTGLTLGLLGTNWFFSAMWLIPSKSLEISMTTTLSWTGVVLGIDISRLEQQFSMPVILSSEYDPSLALITTVLPVLTSLLMYRFVILPRRRTRRLFYLRTARKRLEEPEERRERNAVEFMLRDLARRRNQTEKSKQGLVILEANYGSAEASESTRESTPDLSLDVTILLQALIRNSQLFIAEGEEAKLGLQGFLDPAPCMPKALRIRYLFREQMHYAEIPDYLPAVLPQSEHRVESSEIDS